MTRVPVSTQKIFSSGDGGLGLVAPGVVWYQFILANPLQCVESLDDFDL